MHYHPAFLADMLQETRRAVIMFDYADGTEGNSGATIEGDEARIRAALHGCLGANNAWRAWATDVRTGVLIAGVYYDGRPLDSVPTAKHVWYIGAMKGEMRGNVWDPHAGAVSTYPPLARILEPAEGHVYRGVRGGGNRSVVVYNAEGRCIGFADPIDLGYIGVDVMMKAGVCW